MNLIRVTTIVLACTMQLCFALAEPIRVEEGKKNEGNHIGHNSNLSLPVVNSKLRGDFESKSISNARDGTPDRALNGEKLTIEPGRYNIRSKYGTSIYIKDDVKLVKNIDEKEVFIRSMGGNKYAIHSHEQESYMYVSGSGSDRTITPQPHAHSYEMFYILSRSEDNSVVSFESVKWGTYLKAKYSGDGKSVYTSTNLGGKEKFTLIFKPSDIYTKYPEYTYRIKSTYNTNIRIYKNADEVDLTKNNGSMERIVLRPLCTPECGLYALKSAESGERYVRMPKGVGELIDVQTRVGTNEVIRIYEQNDSADTNPPGPGEFKWASFRCNAFNRWMYASVYDRDELITSNHGDGGQTKWRLYKE